MDSSASTTTEYRVTDKTIIFPSLFAMVTSLKNSECVMVCQHKDEKQPLENAFDENDELAIVSIKLKYGSLAPLVAVFGLEGDEMVSIVTDFDELLAYNFNSEEEKEAYEYVSSKVNVCVKKALTTSFPEYTANFKNGLDDIRFKHFKDFKKVDFDPAAYMNKPGKVCFRLSYAWLSKTKGDKNPKSKPSLGINFGFKCQPTTKWLTDSEVAEHKEELASRTVVYKKQKTSK